MEISERERIRAEAEEEERLKTIRAREPPSHIYLPLYEEMCERREQRSRFNRESSIAATLAIQKPFSFAERDAARLKERVCIHILCLRVGSVDLFLILKFKFID